MNSINAQDLLTRRLVHQALVNSSFGKPVEVVEHMGAIQAQEYAMAKWAIGLRLSGSKDVDIERAYNAGEILRTHVLRPTWHFVSPKDIRWMLELSAPRIHQANSFMCRKLGLDGTLLKRSTLIFAKALEGGNHMMRNELNDVLAKNGINCNGPELGHIMMYAEAEGIVCSGARKGKQFTYALLDEKAPLQKKLKHDEALHKLAKIYFTSRGPASLEDFTTWSNLTVKDAKEAIASLEKNTDKETYNGKAHYAISSGAPNSKALRSFLMPQYDEYGIAYKDRSAIFDAGNHKTSVSRGNPVFNRTIIIDGQIEGTWQ